MDGRLLALMFVMILTAGVAAFTLLRTGRQEKDIALRLEAVAAAGRPKSMAALPSITRRDNGQKGSLKDSLAGLFGFSLQRADQYSLAWPWVIVIALILGRIAVMLSSGFLGSLSWLAMPIATLGVSRMVFGNMTAKRTNKLRNQFPDALGLIVRAVRVGVPVSEALRAVARESVAPTSIEFDKLANEIAIGTALDAALRDMATRNKLPEYGFFAAALSLQAQTGGGLAETLELLADVTRKRLAMQSRGHALSSEARTSSMVLAALPIMSGFVIYLANPGYLSILFTDPTGQMILGMAILSLSIGIFAMRMIIRSALSV